MRTLRTEKPICALMCRRNATLSSIVADLNDHAQEKNVYRGDLRLGGDLSHLESPENDVKLRDSIDGALNSLFMKIPLPNNPLQAALNKTEAEKQIAKVNSVLIEAVRAKYWKQKQMEIIEDERTGNLPMKMAVADSTATQSK